MEQILEYNDLGKFDNNIKAYIYKSDKYKQEVK